MTLQDRIAEILRAHELDDVEQTKVGWRLYCVCDRSFDTEDQERADEHSAHVAALIAAAVEQLRAEVALLRDGIPVRPMTEAESDLMTQVLDLRRERAEARAEVERLREDTGVVNALRRQRDTAEAEVERLRGALSECVAFCRERYDEGSPHEYGDYNTALWDCICNIEAVLRGDQ